MIAPYLFRLLCLSLACFFLVHLALGLAVALMAPAAIRIAGRMETGRAARFLLALRLFPSAFAVLVVAGLCAPSYLWLEPQATAEHVGWACLATAALGLAIWGISIARGVRAATRSLRYIGHCQRVGRQTLLAGERGPVWVMEGAGHCLALAGVIRPRLVISSEVVNALSPEQLAAALRHERAHGVSRDNLKRLLVMLAPDILPFFRAFGAMERGWARITEWAADDAAVGGDRRRSLSLASALVRVARLGAAWQPSPLMTSLLVDSQDLPARVERLLRAAAVREKSGRGMPVLWAGAILPLAGFIAVMLQPATLQFVHRLLEHLIR